MICIGIESTAHTFACAVIDEKGNILSDVRKVYSTEKGGMIPIEVAKHHEEIKDNIINEAIEKSKQKRFDLISYSMSPGLAPCLLVGLNAAKELSRKLKVPLIGVNHCISHLTSGLLFTKAKNPVFVYCSGANTQIIALEEKRYRIFGEALSIAIGNMLDKFGREIGLGFPAGPKIEELAKKGKYIELPYTVKGSDVEFSGVLTKAINLYRKGVSKEDLCYSLQETTFAMLAEISERAIAHLNKKELLLIGGVAANKRFCEMLDIMCKERDARFYAVPLKYSADNAAMIGWQGILEYNEGIKQRGADIKPRQRTDEVKVSWE
ncbi:MAG: KEOPS complex N(6)-L-threonylcarbamoyladenine synthase Kae1 [Candidatus Pacearchaeota archaeon]|jgi:glycoprotease/Kae1 family metallohydrolase|nr:KEOPS complex N(6)-L-threonylcarbamoyladenine synthase Kae1 [Candidatus Pacearchaeota archaeon]|tara:strand:- start:18051 stop:19016 length:966 start_codon:yes stop_codon:yes gene_type:complete